MRYILSLCFVAIVVSGCAQPHRGPGEGRISRTEVSFANDDIVLSGTVIAPSRRATVPGMVLVHGSGQGERSELLKIAEAFAAEGIAVLVYDKRGSGRSEGNWITSSLMDLSADAAAAFRFMTSLDYIDPDSSGYWGISQGGWIVPLAAEVTAPAFAIVVTGGGAAPRQVELFNYRAKTDGLVDSNEASAERDEVLESYMSYLAGDNGYEELDSVLEKYRQRAWFPGLGIEHVVPSESNRRNWEWVATFDPRSSIRNLKIPVLVLLGSADSLTPTTVTQVAWSANLPNSSLGSEVRVLIGAGHGLMAGGHGGSRVSNFIAMQVIWLNSIGIVPKAESRNVNQVEAIDTMPTNAGP